MGAVIVAQQVWIDALADAGTLAGVFDSYPDVFVGLFCDGIDEQVAVLRLLEVFFR